ncbi:hypothetical protein CSOJ01_12836 [Colletotrichum sojae]|uniref:Uncharacterized protein n=1 Tax=Colletotrichum sojae TaxID=2175907 RepID=A0A8H6IUI8_9PEZI|nr:hypothetical protein CSOJ01_12836 [Colletotrichum sojae]
MTSETGMETAGAPRVPYEIFLLIMDAAIDRAYSAASAYRWEFDLILLGEDDSSKQLVVRAYDVRYCEVFRSRFFIIRNISQTDRRTRNAVHQQSVGGDMDDDDKNE